MSIELIESRSKGVVIPKANRLDEIGVLGAMMGDAGFAPIAAKKLDANHFCYNDTRRVFLAICSITANDADLDLHLIRTVLANNGVELEARLGKEIVECSKHSSNGPAYLQNISKRAVLKRAMDHLDQSAKALAKVQKEPGSVAIQPVLEAMATGASELLEATVSKDDRLADIADLSEHALRDLTNVQQGLVLPGTATGFVDLDNYLGGGLNGSDLVILAGRPSMGKTALALNIAENIAVQPIVAAARQDRTLSPKPGVLIFSMEMSGKQLAIRMLSSMSRIDAQKMRKGQLTESDITALTTQRSILAHTDIVVCEQPSLSIVDVSSIAKTEAAAMKARGSKLKLIVLDYIQLMSGSTKRNDSRNNEISHISRGLKGIAKSLDVPVVALSQLNRLVEMRSSKRPIMSDLRESGAIEQDADVILFVHREEYYNHSNPMLHGQAEIIIAKQRNGPAGESIGLSFDHQTIRFNNLGHH